MIRAWSASLLLAAGVAGCGGAGRTQPVSGQAIFASHCALCHSISGRAAPQQQGGDLGELQLPRHDLLQYAAEMPQIRGRMSTRQLRAVVGYVHSVEVGHGSASKVSGGG